MTTEGNAPAAPLPITLGIDLGAATTRLARLDPTKPMPTIVRNELSNESTSTVVSVPAAGRGEARSFGENAVAKQISRPTDTVSDLAEWLFSSSDGNGAAQQQQQLRRVAGADWSAAQLAGYFFKSILRHVPSGGDAAGTGAAALPLCVAVPTSAASTAAAAVRQAVQLAGMPPALTRVAPSEEAAAVYFHHLQYSNLSEETPTFVAIVDVGKSCVGGCALAVTRRSVRKLGVVSVAQGSAFIDTALCEVVCAEVEKKFGAGVLTGDLRSRRRILRECGRAKETLATVEDAKIQLEALQGDKDITIAVTRTKIEELARPFTDALRDAMQTLKTALQAAVSAAAAGEGAGAAGGEAAVPLRVEVIGGGWRLPFVAQVLRDAFDVPRLGVSLDANLAVAEGCAILAEVCAAAAAEEAAGGALYESHRVELAGFVATDASAQMAQPLTEAELAAVQAWQVTEAAMDAADAAISERLTAVNRLDSFLLQTLQEVHECSADAAHKDAAVKYLRELEDYVQNDCDDADTAAILTKLAEAQSHVTAEYPEVQQYRERLLAEERRKEEELARVSREQKSEDTEDLKSDPQRLRVAQRRREQGTTLFREEHWQEAQTRFVQALAILGQLYDVSSEETRKARDEIVLSCHLNIASCSVKLGLWRNAINNCTSALEVSPAHPKAFFRRGQALAATKEYAAAVKDLEMAAQLSHNDALVAAELEAARKNLELQRAKEKKMYAKMFS